MDDLGHIAEPLRQLAVPIADLVPDPRNARVHGERNMAAIEASLRRFGQRVPLVVQRQGMIVRAGNARLEAAKRLGWTHVAAVVVDEDDVQATAFAIADNRTAELAEWDYQELGALLAELGDADVAIPVEDLGWLDYEVESITGAEYVKPEPSGDLGKDFAPPTSHTIKLDGEQLVRWRNLEPHAREVLGLPSDAGEGAVVIAMLERCVADGDE